MTTLPLAPTSSAGPTTSSPATSSTLNIPSQAAAGTKGSQDTIGMFHLIVISSTVWYAITMALLKHDI